MNIRATLTAPFSYNHPPRVSTGLDVIDGPFSSQTPLQNWKEKKRKKFKTPMNLIILVDLFLLKTSCLCATGRNGPRARAQYSTHDQVLVGKLGPNAHSITNSLDRVSNVEGIFFFWPPVKGTSGGGGVGGEGKTHRESWAFFEQRPAELGLLYSCGMEGRDWSSTATPFKCRA